ncbi:GGDEF domain protein [Vibrio sp. JCM 18905]|nr:GGDEF domain protein [Vibrio sp. JCM 18905]
MEQLLSKVTDAGIDPSSVSGEEAITLWEHIGLHIASTNREKAHCYIISAEYRREIKQLNDSIEELRQALELLVLPDDVEDILSVKASLSDRLVEVGDYNAALTEYVAATNIAVEYGYIDEYVLAILMSTYWLLLEWAICAMPMGGITIALCVITKKSMRSITPLAVAPYVCATNFTCLPVTSV